MLESNFPGFPARHQGSIRRLGLSALAALIAFMAGNLSAATSKSPLKDDRATVVGMHVFHILSDTESQAESLYSQLQEVPPSERLEEFKRLAELRSTELGTAKVGGDLGVFLEGVMVPDFDEAALTTPIDEISKPFHTVFGWHVLIVTARQTFDVKPICDSSLRASIDSAESSERAALEMSMADNSKEQFYEPVAKLIGESWGKSFLDQNDDVAFMRATSGEPQSDRRSVQLHLEMTRPILAPAALPEGCYRSVRTTYTADCAHDLLAFEEQVLFEGRGATGRVLGQEKVNPSSQLFEPITPGTAGAQLHRLACQR